MTEKEPDAPKAENEAWKAVGFHRPLAGILYNLVFIIIAAGFGIVLTVWFIPNYVLPFPEALGYTTITTQLFGFYFTLLDLGIGSAIQRYVAEENVRNPRKAIQYIQFFVWYQMISGLGQVTFIAWWVLTMIPQAELAYAAWFFLVYSTIQYPGMLGIFRSTLEAYQRYHKASMISFIQTQIFENILRIIFIFLGRWVGAQYPAIGEVVGAVIGSLIGTYIRDFVTAFLAGHWVAPIMRDIDPTWKVRNLFRVEFDRKVIKDSLLFGLRALVPGLISPVAYMISTYMMVAWLPSYAAVLGMYNVGDMLAQMVTTFSFHGVGASFAESYLNKKYALTRYYFECIHKWVGVFAFFMLGFLFYGSALINVIIGESYSLVMVIIQHFVFFKLINVFMTHYGNFFNGVGKPEYNIYLSVFEQVTRIFVLWLLLVPFPSSWMALVYSTGLGWTASWVVGMVLFDRKILHVRINWWQSFGATGIAAIVQSVFVWWVVDGWFPAFSVIGKVPAAILLIVLLIVLCIFIYFPVYALAGGWDDGSIRVLDRATELSGPSRFLIRTIRSMSIKLAKISPLTNKFPVDETGVQADIDSLMQEQAKGLQKLKNNTAK